MSAGLQVPPTTSPDAAPPGTGTVSTGRTDTGPTSTGPTVRTAVRAGRGPLLLAGLLVVVLVVGALLARGDRPGRLEPESYAPAGARAVATLLAQEGVDVVRVETVDDALEGPRDGTLLLPDPALLTPAELRRLAARPGGLVLVEAAPEALEALDLPVRAGDPVPVQQRRAGCDLPAARTAGDVESGGLTYRAVGVDAVGCYARRGRATVLQVPDERLVLLGSGGLLTNERLAERGNAALALGVLGGGAPGTGGGAGTTSEVRWLVIDPDRDLGAGGDTALTGLLPDWVGPGALQLLVAVVVLALWRARRLGRVVVEPLPVVVRSAEAVEGRGRLYRAAGARDRAGEALRATARAGLALRLGLPDAAAPEALVPLVAVRSGRDATEVDGLLFGPPPRDDAALVALADDLDALRRAATAGSAA